MLHLSLKQAPEIYTQPQQLSSWTLCKRETFSLIILYWSSNFCTKNGQYYKQHEDTQPNQDSCKQKEAEVHEGWLQSGLDLYPLLYLSTYKTLT